MIQTDIGNFVCRRKLQFKSKVYETTCIYIVLRIRQIIIGYQLFLPILNAELILIKRAIIYDRPFFIS